MILKLQAAGGFFTHRTLLRSRGTRGKRRNVRGGGARRTCARFTAAVVAGVECKGYAAGKAERGVGLLKLCGQVSATSSEIE
jgi:hypothetical protein